MMNVFFIMGLPSLLSIQMIPYCYVQNKTEIDNLIKLLAQTFRTEDQGELLDYLGIKIEMKQDGKLE
jgi:hypothetical protein